jgi:hypothetical protein
MWRPGLKVVKPLRHICGVPGLKQVWLCVSSDTRVTRYCANDAGKLLVTCFPANLVFQTVCTRGYLELCCAFGSCSGVTSALSRLRGCNECCDFEPLIRTGAVSRSFTVEGCLPLMQTNALSRSHLRTR